MKKLYAIITAALLLCGCTQNDNLVTETAVVGSEVQTANTVTEDLQDNSASMSLTSRTYEFDLSLFLDNDDSGRYDLRNELDFLSDEQYEAYIRALIFTDEIEYFNIPNTNGTTHWLDEGGKIYDSYYYLDSDGVTVPVPYVYISDRSSFEEYLNSVFTKEAVSEIMSNDRFYNVDGELYFEWGEKGGPVYFQGGQYKEGKNDDAEVIFEYVANHEDDETKWTETHTIELVNTDEGWRSEWFGYLYTESQ